MLLQAPPAPAACEFNPHTKSGTPVDSDLVPANAAFGSPQAPVEGIVFRGAACASRCAGVDGAESVASPRSVHSSRP